MSIILTFFGIFKNLLYKEYYLNCSSIGVEPILFFSFNKFFTLLFYSLKMWLNTLPGIQRSQVAR